MNGWKNFQICSKKMNFANGNYKQYYLVPEKVKTAATTG